MLRNLGRRNKQNDWQDDNPAAYIELRQVVKKFHNAAGEFTVLKNIDLDFQPGEFASIVGRSGSGKSTLLNMITGIDHPSGGFVRVGNEILAKMDEGSMSVWRGRSMGIVFQFFQLLPMLTLIENVMLPMDFCDTFPPTKREARAMDLLAQVGLAGLEYKYPAAVSGGQQQSAAVARALANDPPILIADEPTGNLDTQTAETVLGIFEEQAQKGKTILMVTHDSVLAKRARRIIIISDGEVIQEGISNAFPSVAHDILLNINQSAKIRRFRENEILFDGNSSTELAIITRGKAQIVARGLFGAQVVVEDLEPGSIFSIEDLKSSKKQLVGLIAKGPVEALFSDHIPETGEIKDVLTSVARARAAKYARASLQRGNKGVAYGD